MVINRRRAPSSIISSQKKLGGHKIEVIYANLIGGSVIGGTQKGDVKDKNGDLHSVKSGRKWQIFLYAYKRIAKSIHLKILLSCLEAFPKDYTDYVADRIKCVSYKEKYVLDNGRKAAQNLSNDYVAKNLGANSYIEAKKKLKETTFSVCEKLGEKLYLRNFLEEALFNNKEVTYLAILDTTYKKDKLFKVFYKEDVLDILSEKLYPYRSKAGNVAEDYNIAGQKTLLRYKKTDGNFKNIVEIEIRNDSKQHYRQVRFNMYSKDALDLLINDYRTSSTRVFNKNVVLYGCAIQKLDLWDTKNDFNINF